MMRPNFEGIIQNYSEDAKDAIKPENLTKEGREEFKAHMTSEFKENSQERATSAEVQEEIFKIQKKKQELILKLHKQFKKIENDEIIEKEGAPIVSYDIESNRFIAKDQNGHESSFLYEDLLTDGEWGLAYSLDTSIPAPIRKEYALSETRREISRLLDKQIILDETGSLYTDDFKKDAYSAIEKGFSQDSMQSGVIAERMVKNLLKKIALRSGSLFEVEDANVYQDVHQKIDFIVHKTQRSRAVGVVEDPKKNIGIQFTLNKEKVDLKERQIASSKRHLNDTEEIDDILLVTTEMGYAKELFNEWNKTKRPGGPERNISAQDTRKIFSEVMDGVLSEDEIERVLQRIPG